METAANPFAEWAVVEVMGHQTYAGFASEQVVAGAALLRVDVPEVDGRPAFAKLIGMGSVYAITPVSEEVARRAAASLRKDPLPVYMPEFQPRREQAALMEPEPEFYCACKAPVCNCREPVDGPGLACEDCSAGDHHEEDWGDEVPHRPDPFSDQ